MNVVILDNSLEQISLISSYTSLTFNRQFNNRGSFEIVVNLNGLNAKELLPDRIIYLDPNRCGIIERIEILMETNRGGETLIASGIEIKDLIGRRLVLKTQGESAEEYSNQTPEYIVRDLLAKHIISPTNNSRQIPIFELGQSYNLGNAIDYSCRNKLLDDEIYQILSVDRLGFQYYVDLATKKVKLEIVEGIDRTVEQIENPTSIFSLALGTADRSTTLQDKQAYRNMVYVGGDGEGTEKAIVSVPSSIEPEGIARRETYFGANDANTTEELTARGMSKLSELEVIYHVDAIANNSANTEYGLGDHVTFRDMRTNAYENVQITGITETYAGASPPKKTLIFGRAPLSIAAAINSRLSGLKAIETK